MRFCAPPTTLPPCARFPHAPLTFVRRAMLAATSRAHSEARKSEERAQAAKEAAEKKRRAALRKKKKLAASVYDEDDDDY